MMYKIIYNFFPGFLKEMKKYNEKYKHLKDFKERNEK